MFEDICIVCGKPLHDVGRAYCSNDCQTSDISPSISSSSSARSSPNINCTRGDEVPPLMPLALGSALKNYMACNPHHVSSSSASFDEDDEAIQHFNSPSSDYDIPGIYGASPQSATIPSGLSYARRPSGTNNSSTVRYPHRNICADSSYGHMRSIPRTVPIFPNFLPHNVENYFGIDSLPQDALHTDHSNLLSERDGYPVKPKCQGIQASKRTSNWASLPTQFSSLHMTTMRSSPVSSSSGNTIARRSLPPTLDNTLSQAQFPPTLYSPPRGRRRESGNYQDSQHSVNLSTSDSPSKVRSLGFGESSGLVDRSFPDLEGSAEQLFDWSSIPRGRAKLRRNSSPLPKIIGMEDTALMLAVRSVHEAERFECNSRPRAPTRGRARVEDLGGDTHSNDAPGFGFGRSGLLDRERGSGAQSIRLPF